MADNNLINPEEYYQLEQVIGEGSYGQVYKAIQIENGRSVAIKIVPSTGEIESLKKEIQILRDCRCDNIVKYFDSYYYNGQLWLVMEHCTNGSVIDLVKSMNNSLPEELIATILYQTLKGIDYLHANKKIHRDIKCGNILIDNMGNIKIADFGVSTQLINTMAGAYTMIGSPFWMSPEIIQKSQYNKKTDIWSLGITAIEMAEGEPPYSHLFPVKAMFAIQHNPPRSLSDEQKWSKEFNNFVKKCLIFEQKNRPSTKELLNDPFFQRFCKNREYIQQFMLKNYRSIEAYKQHKQFRQSEQQYQHQQKFQQDQGVNLNTLVECEEEEDLGTMIVNPDIDIDSKILNETGTMLEHQYQDIEDYEQAIQRVSEYGLQSLNQLRIPTQSQESPLKKKKVIEEKINQLNDEMNNEIAKIKQKYGEQIQSLKNILIQINIPKHEQHKSVHEQKLFQPQSTNYYKQMDQKLKSSAPNTPVQLSSKIKSQQENLNLGNQLKQTKVQQTDLSKLQLRIQSRLNNEIPKTDNSSKLLKSLINRKN